ncbi:NAD(P)-dependent alcohol dehydrogenase [Actinophytocola oryzae]|uniref:NADPH:quinone reductase-like Zn-dependent oxidoreductase n=1 Tax=Actinophytocola oryzae TaxID=502181 RepID=A0A4R7VXJ1_9PSEU|nr:NAD(P)-dependent alcohol dehydrogenase [Actinophytocola oryzae]TDV54856.1 NADPH:quinone reductase-like Zn-dependent oxidoreductase [Actinophytocola oryzae]
MKAIVQDRYGSPDVLEFRAVDTPVADDDEVLVEVHAASVNAADWHIMRGDPYIARLTGSGVGGLRAPASKIRGCDFAGRVAATGRNVTGFEPGDEVFGDLGPRGGTFAEFVAVPAGQVAHKPSNLTFEQAAAVPLAANTALIGLRDDAKVQAGQRVLINGASGGVGTFAVQLAKSYGAEVTAVCSTRNAALVRDLGADHVVDYTREDFTRNGRRYDVLFDLVGNHSLGAFRRALTPEGVFLLSGGGTSEGGSLVGPMGLFVKAQLMARFVRQRLVTVVEVPSSANLVALRELIEAGEITPVIDRIYPLGEAAEAIRYVEREHARAKVVVTV